MAMDGKTRIIAVMQKGEPMDDLISRQAATKHLKHRLYETAMNNDDLAGVFSEIADNRIETWIEELPSAQPEQKKGKWIEIDDDLISGRCSQCGWEAHLYEDDVFGMDYCPNCGTRLEVEE